MWAACSLLTVLAAWFLCRRLDRLRGTGDTADDAGEAGLVLALQVSVVMVLGLLISPISWSHHWVWCLPALMSVGAATWRWRSIALGVAGVAGVLVFFLAMQWWFPRAEPRRAELARLGQGRRLELHLVGPGLRTRPVVGLRPTPGGLAPLRSRHQRAQNLPSHRPLSMRPVI